MARGKLIFENEEGKLKKAPIGYSYLALLLGPFFPMFRGQIGHAELGFILLVPTFGISWLTYPAVINIFYRQKLLNEGYKLVGLEDISAEELERRTGINIETGEHAGNAGATLKFALIQLIPIALFTGLIVNSQLQREHLRKVDPQAYLESIRYSSRYWDELKEIDPDRYKREWPAEERRRKEAAERRQREIEEKNAALAWEGELYSRDVPDGIYCSEEYGGGTLEPHYRAYTYGTDYIKDNLIATASGNFPVIDYTAIYHDACTYTFYSWFEAQNVFGAEIRTYYKLTVELEDDEDGGYSIYGFRQGERSRLLRK